MTRLTDKELADLAIRVARIADGIEPDGKLSREDADSLAYLIIEVRKLRVQVNSMSTGRAIIPWADLR